VKYEAPEITKPFVVLLQKIQQIKAQEKVNSKAQFQEFMQEARETLGHREEPKPARSEKSRATQSHRSVTPLSTDGVELHL
jgi:hypothetical protein